MRRAPRAPKPPPPPPPGGRSKDVVALVALVAAGAFGGWLAARARGTFGETWSDGRRIFASETGAFVRHAVWDAPEDVPGFEREAAEPALSPDGRWLVFASGERGLNAELFVAERLDGALSEPEPLVALNTGSDELAPAFALGALYFASDRPGGVGGLDLWRASYADGVFGAAERIGPGLNTAADESDPAPFGEGLVFASDRALRSGFDLYRAAPDAQGFYVPEPLAALNTEADERDPAPADDLRSLYFASDRAGGAGRFDLYRAVRAADGWSTPAPVPGLNTTGSERGPWIASDGFALYFDSTDDSTEASDGTERGLRLARSRELFRLPNPGVRTSEWLLLAGLLALSALAALAKRWHGLDMQYKCLLGSLVVHILVMLYLSTVSPRSVGGGSAGAGTGAPEEGTIQLTLRPRRGGSGGNGGASGSGSGGGGSAIAGGARGGPALARANFAPSSGGAPAPAAARLDASAASAGGSESGPAPERSAAPAVTGSVAGTALAVHEAPLGRFAAAAPELALDARASAGRGGGASTSSVAPARATETASVSLGRAEPGAATGAAPLAGGASVAAAEIGASGPAPAGLAREASGAASGAASVAGSTRIAGPRENLGAPAGASPTFALSAISSAGRAGEGGGALGSAPRRGVAAAPAALGPAGPERDGGTAGALASALGVNGGAGAVAAPPRTELVLGGGAASGGASATGDGGGVLVRGPTAEPGPPSGGGASQTFDATDGLASTGAEGNRGGGDARDGAGSGPGRAPSGAGAGGLGNTSRASPGIGASVPGALASATDGLESDGPGRGRLEPLGGSGAGDGASEAGASGLALRGPGDARGPGGDGAGSASASFDAIAGLGTGADAGAGTRGGLGGGDGGPTRARGGSGTSGTSGGEAGATSGERALPSRGAGIGPGVGEASATGADTSDGPARGLLARGGTGDGSGGAPDGDGIALRAPTGPVEGEGGGGAPAGGSAPAFDAFDGLGQGTAARTTEASAAPERARLGAGLGSAGAPRPGAPLALAVPAPELVAPPADDAPPPRVAETPYQNRFGEQKLRALEEFGGTAETEHAVAAGLAYLARIQGESGAWGQRSDAHEKYLDVRIGKSALALLAFLGAGHVPGGSGAHAAVAERTVGYLLASQDAESGHFGRSCSYGHGIATYALAECFALTQDERLRTPLERAVAEILRHQSDVDDPRFFGGWGYYFADGHVWNRDEWPRTSVTAWQVMALESARLGGLVVPDAAFEGARTFLLETWDASAKAFRYDHDPERLNSGYPILPASTPAALFALSLMDVDPRAAELASARRFVLARAPDGYRYTGDDDFVRRARGNLYFWYYATLAMFRVGGKEWEHWNVALQQTLLTAQDEDGSWRPIDTYSDYAGDDDEERTYSTAMCVLSLEVYYRYFTPLLKVR